VEKKMTKTHEERSGELLGPYDISKEEWREYEWDNGQGERVVYRINKPSKVLFRQNGKTHRVVDTKRVVHCVPAPGYLGCVLRWFNPKGPECNW
jgi:hypothetical protein